MSSRRKQTTPRPPWKATVEAFMQAAEPAWKPAKTVSEAPHEYVTMKDLPEAVFFPMKDVLRQHGYQEKCAGHGA